MPTRSGSPTSPGITSTGSRPRQGHLADGVDWEHRYRETRASFEARHGEIVEEYWSITEPSGVALTRKKPPLLLRPFVDDTRRFHRATDWVTRDAPPVADALFACETLAIRGRGGAQVHERERRDAAHRRRGQPPARAASTRSVARRSPAEAEAIADRSARPSWTRSRPTTTRRACRSAARCTSRACSSASGIVAGTRDDRGDSCSRVSISSR